MIGWPVGPMIGHRIGLLPERMRYSVNNWPSSFTVTPSSDFSTVNVAAESELARKSRPSAATYRRNDSNFTWHGKLVREEESE